MSSLIFFIGMLLMAASIPLSVFGMSVSQFILIGGWLLEGAYKQRINQFVQNKPAVLWCGLYLIHLIAALWSSDTDYLLKDLRIKLPLLFLPFLLTSFPGISKKQIIVVLKVFIASVAISTLISTGVWLDLLPHQNQITDIREISVFISHIRLSLCIVFSLFLLIWFAIIDFKNGKRVSTAIKLLLATWFIIFLFIMESMTGVIVLLISGFILAIRLILKRKTKTAGFSILVILIILVTSTGVYIKKLSNELYRPFDYSAINPDEKTSLGNTYYHCFDCKAQENGTPVYIYISEAELDSAWNSRSKISYYSRDSEGNEIKYTLLRYLASKGLKKDAEAVASLSNKEIHSIENGLANWKYKNIGNLNVRLQKTIMEYFLYRQGGNPTGSSLLQRLEYWKTGLHIFKDHLFFGVGTGDVKITFDKYYDQMNSPLSLRWRLRAHNQYLTFGIAFGIFGLIYFFWILIYPFFTKLGSFLPFVAFWSIFTLSMLTEDTLETQAGVSFSVYFMSLFFMYLYHHSPNRNH